MKRIFVILSIILLSIEGIGQMNSNTLSIPIGSWKSMKTHLDLKSRADSLDYQILYTRYCLNKYRQEQLTAIGLEIGGIITAIYASQLPSEDLNALLEYNRTIMSYPNNNDNARREAMRALTEANNKLDNKREFVGFIAGGLVIGGGILHILSYRWLKKTLIQPSRDRIGIIIHFPRKVKGKL